MFKVLLTTTNGATLFHCTAGKDRTGFAAFLILSALGVPRETIIKDYLLTNEVTADVRKKWLAGIRKNSAGLGNVDAVVSNRNALASVNADYLNTALATIKEESGDVGHYLTDYLGLSKGDLTTLRHLYLD